MAIRHTTVGLVLSLSSLTTCVPTGLDLRIVGSQNRVVCTIPGLTCAPPMRHHHPYARAGVVREPEP